MRVCCGATPSLNRPARIHTYFRECALDIRKRAARERNPGELLATTAAGANTNRARGRANTPLRQTVLCRASEVLLNKSTEKEGGGGAKFRARRLGMGAGARGRGDDYEILGRWFEN